MVPVLSWYDKVPEGWSEKLCDGKLEYVNGKTGQRTLKKPDNDMFLLYLLDLVYTYERGKDMPVTTFNKNHFRLDLRLSSMNSHSSKNPEHERLNFKRIAYACRSLEGKRKGFVYNRDGDMKWKTFSGVKMYPKGKKNDTKRTKTVEKISRPKGGEKISKRVNRGEA